MPLTIACPALAIYTLPADGPQAEADFLALLRSPGETFLADYGFDLPALVAEIEQADAAGIPVHLLLDRTQAAGHAERPVLEAMAARIAHGDVTLSTAGPDSRSPSQIMHSKALVARATDGGESWCWLGSVNFSVPGWLQANQAVCFRSDAYAAVFVSWFERTRTWARLNIPQLAIAAPSVAIPAAIVVSADAAAQLQAAVPHVAQGGNP